MDYVSVCVTWSEFKFVGGGGRCVCVYEGACMCGGVHMRVLCICDWACDPEGPVPESLVVCHFYDEECPRDGTVCAPALTPTAEDQVEQTALSVCGGAGGPRGNPRG